MILFGIFIIISVIWIILGAIKDYFAEVRFLEEEKERIRKNPLYRGRC